MATRLLDRSARMWLFYLKHLQGKRGKLSASVTREVCEYLADCFFLAHVAPTFLRFFNFHTLTWGPQVHLKTEIYADSWVVLEDRRVFCCGSATYILAGDGSVEQKAGMNERRYGHGLIHVNNTPYAFGGLNLGPLKSCEQFKLLNNEWIALPSMREARWNFNPCMFFGIVYVCGFRSSIMEAFAPHTASFLPLHVQLPEAQACCLYVHNLLLVVHSENYIVKFAREMDGQLRKCSETSSPAVSKYQTSQPVVDTKHGVVFMSRDGKCVSFAMETGVEGAAIE